MATITFSMASTPLTASKTVTGTDADMQDLLNWAATTYALTIQQMFNPTGNGGFVPTNAQIGAALVAVTVANWKGAVLNSKNGQAALTAAQTVVAPTWA